MRAIPRDPSPDSTLAFLLDGYRFISTRCDRYGSDVFQTRLLFEPTICLRGAEAARIFYDTERFQRSGAIPGRAQKSLFGVDGVQVLDGAAHRVRKRLLLSLMTPDRTGEVADRFGQRWRSAVDDWARRGTVVLHDEVAELLCRTACEWVGIPLPEKEAPLRTADLTAMIKGPAAVGPTYWRGRRARRRGERWVGGWLDAVRAGACRTPAGSGLQVIGEHREPDGRLLDRKVAAVELLNLLRPMVAVSRYIAFAALALHRQPRWRDRLRDSDEDVELFVQEVRRFFPFFPAAAALVRRDFDWAGYHFPRGRRVLLDVYGTNRDPRLWPRPGVFDPDRFRNWRGSPFTFIPQGGGDHLLGHRCPGEWLTIDLMKVAVAAMTRWMTYEVPAQDLRVDGMPAGVHSGMILSAVRPAAARPPPDAPMAVPSTASSHGTLRGMAGAFLLLTEPC